MIWIIAWILIGYLLTGYNYWLQGVRVAKGEENFAVMSTIVWPLTALGIFCTLLEDWDFSRLVQIYGGE